MRTGSERSRSTARFALQQPNLLASCEEILSTSFSSFGRFQLFAFVSDFRLRRPVLSAVSTHCHLRAW